MQKWGIDKRVTLWLLSKGKIASSPQLTLLVMMYITAFISMCVSKSVTTAIILLLVLEFWLRIPLTEVKINMALR